MVHYTHGHCIWKSRNTVAHNRKEELSVFPVLLGLCTGNHYCFSAVNLSKDCLDLTVVIEPTWSPNVNLEGNKSHWPLVQKVTLQPVVFGRTKMCKNYLIWIEQWANMLSAEPRCQWEAEFLFLALHKVFQWTNMPHFRNVGTKNINIFVIMNRWDLCPDREAMTSLFRQSMSLCYRAVRVLWWCREQLRRTSHCDNPCYHELWLMNQKEKKKKYIPYTSMTTLV